MKLAEKLNYAFESEQKFHHSYSFYERDLKVKGFEGQQFVVPWQIEEKKKRETVLK